MYLATVTGTVVSTTKHSSLNGMKLLIVSRLDEHLTPTGRPQVAVDTVGAGNGEIVIVSTGSSARMTDSKEHSVIDAAIVGIVDATERGGE
ncbi:EutN/CcmL family microcompartment protein [Brenneria corticis]|uniref:Ethanolamine utilization protein EutN n=1 Tax=Brenneria corticis TaxID=2173106 RepID=A0A2U1UBA2_9GAMM|nr:EutN/CcmL family microcompartment protein [Brenneria sp. CFCC 11842]PWC18844.1 ethanolamine utilization protein EutN [Brenneria sp. CFCC 11842]